QRNIDDRDVWFDLRHQRQRDRRALGISTNLEISLLVDEIRQPLAHKRMVIDQKNSSWCSNTHQAASFCAIGVNAGIVQVTSVPPVGFGSIESCPLIIVAR